MPNQTIIKMRDILVSVVIAVRNGESYLAGFIEELSQILADNHRYYEIVIVDDGSTDQTVAIVEKASKKYKNIQLYCLTRAKGEEIAIIAGLDKAVGDFMVTLRPRCDPPALIPKMLEIALEEQVHIVYGLCRQRLESGAFYHRMAKGFYSLLTKMSDIEVPAAISSYRLFSRSVLNFMLESSDRHRTLAIAQALSGYSYRTIDYDRIWRDNKYRKSIRFGSLARAVGLVLSTSAWPLRFIMILSLGVSCLTAVYSIYVLLVAFLMEDVAPGWASLSLQIAGLMFLVFIILAVMSEYLLQITETTSRRPLYYISREQRSSVMDYLQSLNVEQSGDEKDPMSLGSDDSIPLVSVAKQPEQFDEKAGNKE